MAQVTLSADKDFCRQLMETGAENLKKCYQCGTCSVACPMTPEARPFPRKEMLWASFGQKEKFMKDIDLWVCHNCGNCSELCPRGAGPAQLMSAGRDMIYQDLIPCAGIARWLSSLSGLFWLFLIPAVLWFIVWWIRAEIVGSWFPRTDGRIVFGAIFYGDYTIDPIFMITFFGAIAVLWYGCTKLWASFKPKGGLTVIGKKKCWLVALWEVLWEEVIYAKKFLECEFGPKTGVPRHSRRISHTILVWSFCILACVTTIVAIGHWGGKLWPAILIVTPMPQLFWVKILANIGAILLIIALCMLTWRRWNLNPKYETSGYYDWYLLNIIWAVALTGMFTQIFRLMDCLYLAYIVYYVHLVVVWMLFAYVPWTKLGHFVYRTLAMVYVKMYGRSY